MTLITIALLFLTCAIANIVATITGFGLSTVLTPVLLSFFPIKETIFLVCIIHLFHDAMKLFFFYPSINFQLTAGFGFPAVIGSVIASSILVTWHTAHAPLILGLFLLGYTAILLWHPSFQIKQTWLTVSFGGLLTGFIAGIFGIVGAVRSIFLLSFDPNKDSFVATSALISFLVNITRIATYTFAGLTLSTDAFVLLPFLVLLSFLGVALGRLLLEWIPTEWFKPVVLVFLVIAASKLIFT